MDPIDYTSAFSSTPSPTSAFTQGLQNGVAFDQLQRERAQQQAAAAQQQQKHAVLADLVSKGADATADDYVKAGLQVPELSAQFKQFWDMKNTDQQQHELQRISGWAAAIDSGQPKIASDAMRAQADAIENTAGAPTQESKGLRAKAEQVDANPQAANVIIKSMIAAHPNGAKAIDGIAALGKESRAADLAPAELRTANAKAGAEEADVSTKNLGIVAQQAGALAKPGIKPTQAITMFKSLEARGIIPKGGAQDYIDGIPADPKALPDYLKQIQASGMTSKEQMTYTTPTADAALSANTQVQTTGMNNRTQLAVQDRIDARNQGDTNVKHGALGLSEAQNEALFGENGAVTTGRLDPNRINSRTAALYADAFIKNPKVDMAKISGDIALGRNATFRQNAMTAEVLPEIMQNMVNAGKKLKFSDNRTIGKMQGWIKGEVNDPDMVEYMTQRNDALMTVARVMRGAGMTDMAHKAETEVSAPTMSPDALDAWMRGQMKSLQPRLDINHKITKDAPAHPLGPAAASAHPADISALLNKYGSK